MEPNLSHSIFELQLDDASRGYLRETAKWAKLIGIISLVLGALVAVEGLVFVLTGSALAGLGQLQSMASVAGFFYMGLGILSIYPGWKLVRFASGLPAAFDRADQTLLMQSFGNLRLAFRFWGITLIAIFTMFVLLFIGVAFFASGF